MKQTFAPLVSLAFVFLWSSRILAADVRPNSSDAQAKPQSYPWSEASDYVRVPKSFLNEITIFAVTMTNTETRQYVLSDDFVRTYKLTTSEVERLTKAIADALHEYRTIQGKFLEPTQEEPDRMMFGRGRAAPAEKFNFKLTPFPKEAAAIRQKLEETVISTLGEERSKFFWQPAGLLESEMKTFTYSRESPLPPGMVRSTIFIFELPEPASRVDFYRYDITRRVDGGRGGGGGGSGSTYGEFLDQYAPAPMKPILARWRKAIAETAAKNKDATAVKNAGNVELKPVSQAVAESTTPRATRLDDSSPTATKWDDRSPFVDLPKSLLSSLRIPGLTVDGDISPEATAFFGLAGDDQKAIQELYSSMKARFEKLEREHFSRVEPDKNSFVLKAFPEKSAALKEEWTKKLKTLVGEQRAEMLDKSIRTGPDVFRMMRRNAGPGPDFERFRSPGEIGPGWLQRGTNETRINITVGPGRDGKQTILQMEYQTDAGGRGSGGVPGGQIPERWRHLITPDMLGLPLTL